MRRNTAEYRLFRPTVLEASVKFPHLFLLAGLDTVEYAYFLNRAFGSRLDASERFEQSLDKIHEPLTWRAEGATRVALMRRG